MKKAIITGASGFVGIHLATELLANNIEVIALCREESTNIKRLPKEVSIIYSADDLPNADVFYHLAWKAPSGSGRGNAMLQSENIELTLNALNTAHKLGAKFVALGTIAERFYETITQLEKFGNSHFYILAKNFAHQISNQLAYQLNCEYTWCHICHPIGRFIKPEQLMAYTVSGLISGNPPIFGPANKFFDIVAVEDVALGLYLIGKHNTNKRDYYIGSGNPMLLRDYLTNVRQILSVNTPLFINQHTDDELHFEKNWFNIKPLSLDTGYLPKINFEQAIKNVYDYILLSKHI